MQNCVPRTRRLRGDAELRAAYVQVAWRLGANVLVVSGVEMQRNILRARVPNRRSFNFLM